MKYWVVNIMRERLFTILSTASLPLERMSPIPDGVDIQVDPLIEIIRRNDEKLISQITGLSSKKITAVFTSAYAVKFVADQLDKKTDWEIYCIRRETRNAVEHCFGIETIKKFADNALQLSREIINDEVKEAVFFCGDQRLNILPDNLLKNGVQLTELIVYDTRLTPKRLNNVPDAILFFSPTAVRSFFSMNKLSLKTIVFAMGTTTADALRQNTDHPVIISPESDKAFVFNMALEYAVSHPII